MNPLLIAINAKYIHTNNAIRLLKANSRYNVNILDFTIKDSPHEMLETIIKMNPSIIGFSVYIWNVEIVKPLLKALKEKLDIPIILGGPEVSYDPVHFIETLPVHAIIKGEGEAVFDLVVDALLNHKPLTNIPSITAYASQTLINTPIEEINDLSTLKSPYHFTEDIQHIPNKIAYIEASRGCPYRCSYCLSSLEDKVRFFPLDTVKEAINTLQEKGAKTFKFLDRTFNANKTMLALIDYIIDTHKKGTVFQFEITGDTLDPKIVDAIHARAPKNLFRFEIGIQSTNEETNRLVDRRQNNAKLFAIINKIEAKGIIDLHLDLIAGLPKEDLTSFKETFNSVFLLGSKELQLGFLKMLRGTKIRYQSALYGYQYNQEAPYEIIENNALSKDDIVTIKNVEIMLNTLHNKGFFGALVVEYIKTHNLNAFDFFYEAYKAYTKANYPLKRYQIETLYLFMHNFVTKNATHAFQDALLKEYLLRSKVKPKGYLPFITDKPTKKALFEQITKAEGKDINTLYKHAVCANFSQGYYIALYQNHQAQLFTIQK